VLSSTGFVSAVFSSASILSFDSSSFIAFLKSLIPVPSPFARIDLVRTAFNKVAESENPR